MRATKAIHLKNIVDEALEICERADHFVEVCADCMARSDWMAKSGTLFFNTHPD